MAQIPPVNKMPAQIIMAFSFLYDTIIPFPIQSIGSAVQRPLSGSPGMLHQRDNFRFGQRDSFRFLGVQSSFF
jgi:hypothetical protein